MIRFEENVSWTKIKFLLIYTKILHAIRDANNNSFHKVTIMSISVSLCFIFQFFIVTSTNLYQQIFKIPVWPKYELYIYIDIILQVCFLSIIINKYNKIRQLSKDLQNNKTLCLCSAIGYSNVWPDTFPILNFWFTS